MIIRHDKKIYFGDSLILRLLFFLCILIPLDLNAQERAAPNFLWIVSEDNSPMAGAYGDEFATTPNIDKLASEGFLYTNAHANAPVCAPARNTIITGVYATTGGNQHMRSTYRISGQIQPFPLYLRERGYYVTNNPKEDYNIYPAQTSDIWHESGNRAHYRDREDGQPFFAVFNSNLSHEGTIHSLKPVEELRHDPQAVDLPPYHPDTPEIRRDWAQYYDNIEDMDRWVGEVLQELEESGEAENTIVFYYGDHGGVLPRSKRFVYETGTRVPFIVRIPEKYRDLWPAEAPGSQIDRPVSFVDLAPTLLSLTGAEIPDYMQGHAFLGEQATASPEYVHMFRGRMDERYDMSRAVRDGRFRYIRNYMPYRIYGQRLDYLWRANSIRSWEQTCLEGRCNEVQSLFWGTKPVEELYDTMNDPWEVHNLAGDPDYRQILERMRRVNRQWILDTRDSGFIPEAELSERAGERAIYDYMRSDEVPFEEIVDAAELAVTAGPDSLPVLAGLLQHGDSAVRYWAATGLLIAGERAAGWSPDLKGALSDPSPNVVTIAAEALYRLGEVEEARTGFVRALEADNEFARTHVLNAIDSVDEDSDQIRSAVLEMAVRAGTLTRAHYDHRAAKVLFDKWDLDATEHGVVIDW